MGDPIRPAAFAVSATTPAVVPSTRVAVAIPAPFVMPDVGVNVPAPPAAHVTATPDTGLPDPSVTFTESSAARVAPIVSLCDAAPSRAMFVAAPAVPVARISTGLPVRPAAVAVSVSGPAVEPRVQDPTVAIPDASVTGEPPVTVPERTVEAKVTVTPGTTLPWLSCTITDGGVTGVFTVALWRSPEFTAMSLALPCVAVAVKPTGEPVRPPTDAVAVCVLAVAPSVHWATAIPVPLVIDVAGIEPPPEVTAQLTVTPGTGFTPSVTSTESSFGRAARTVSVCPLPPASDIVVAAPEFPKSMKRKGLPVSPADVAMTVSGPAVAPSVQVPRLATPEAFVVGVVPVMAPFRAPPAARAKLTATPEIGLPNWSVTFAPGGVPTAVFTVAAWPFVPTSALRIFAAPWVAVAVKLTGEPVNPATVPVAPWDPAAVPRTRVALATPFAPVIEVGVILPPPVTPHVTVTPATGFPARSLTVSVYAMGSVPPTVSVCASPAPLIRVAP